MASSIFELMFLYFVHFHFYILIVYHREHVLIFSWHQKGSISSCWMFARWLFRWIKNTLARHSLHVLLLISSDLTPLPFESSGRWMGKEGKAAATFYALDSVPVESRQEKECTVLIHDGMKLWQFYRGEINSGYFCLQCFSFFFFSSFL